MHYILNEMTLMDVVESLFLEVFKKQLDMVLGAMI